MKQPTRIVLVDDHDLVRKGLHSLLCHEPDLQVAGEAKTLADAVPLVTRLHPHLVLLEMNLPDASGMEACRQLLATAPQLRILVFTSQAEDTMVAAAIRCGAHGYLIKDLKATELIRAIRIVAGGRGYLDPRITQYALRWIRAGIEPDSKLHGMKLLSSQERLIMPLLARGKTNKEIAAGLHLSDKTIKNYLANIYDKLGVTRRSEAVARFARNKDHEFFP